MPAGRPRVCFAPLAQRGWLRHGGGGARGSCSQPPGQVLPAAPKRAEPPDWCPADRAPVGAPRLSWGPGRGAPPKASLGIPGPAAPRFDIELLVSLLRQENARDVCVIRVAPEVKYADYLVVVSGSSTRHLQAMAQYVVKTHKFLKSRSDPYVRIEGKDADDWLCVDFGSMVIHFMLPETRETYELEKLWTLGTYDDQLAEMAPESLPEDFILGLPPEEEPAAWSVVEAKRE